jgi:hypothetical protein
MPKSTTKILFFDYSSFSFAIDESIINKKIAKGVSKPNQVFRAI